MVAKQRVGRRLVTLAMAFGAATATIAIGSTPASAAAPPQPKPVLGKQPPGLGMGSKAALAQANCDPERKRTNYATVGGGPFCVNPWSAGKDNGGATAPGVTATSVKGLVFTPTTEQEATQKSRGGALPVNQVTGAQGTWEDAFRDFNTVAVQGGAYQTWGRTVELEFQQSSGSDEAAQRADALAVAAKKPFIVIDATDQSLGMPVFESEVAKSKIIVNGAGITTEAALAQAPYRWNTAQDNTAGAYIVGELVGKTLSKKKAEWAGAPDLQKQTRNFGVVYAQNGTDIDLFNKVVVQWGGTAPKTELAYDSSDSSQYEEAARTMIAKMKSSGVNNVVLFAEPAMVTALMKAATGNEFSPEWTITGYQFQDFDGFGRGADQTQYAHAFGVGTLMPLVSGQQATLGAFPWYWGTKQGTANPTVSGWTGFIYGAIHYAGPTLTAENVQKGLFAVPALGGAAQGRVTFQTGYGRSVALPYDEHSALGTDKALIWWDPTAHGGANAVATIVGDGKFRYVDDGKRVRYGQLPTKVPPYFDTAKAVTEISPELAGAGVGAQEPCPGCPSSQQ
jgi:hypothetical protein